VPSITTASQQPTLNKVPSIAQQRLDGRWIRERPTEKVHGSLQREVPLEQARKNLISADPALQSAELTPLW